MECPACKNTLTKVIKASVQVLACENECGGLWFSQPQVKKLKKLKAGLGTSLLKIKRADGIKVYRGAEHICPQCRTTLLFRHFFSKELDTEVNQCAKCGGFWIDVAGLSKLQSMNGQQKQKAVDKYFSIIFHKKISGIHKKISGTHILNEDVDRATKNIIQIFRFLCPEEDFPEAGKNDSR